MELRRPIILGAIIIIALIGVATNGLCDEMTRGFVSRVDKYRVVLEVPNTGNRTFDVTGKTSVIWNKQVIPVTELRTGTLVQITSKNGDALQILVVEVPK